VRQPWIIIGILVLGIAAIVWFFDRRPSSDRSGIVSLVAQRQWVC
jgi:hypothetical protein